MLKEPKMVIFLRLVNIISTMYVGPYATTERVREVAYKLDSPEDFRNIPNALDVQLDEKLNYV